MRQYFKIGIVLIILLGSLSFNSCKAPAPEYTNDLAGLKMELADKRSEMKVIKSRIKVLQDSIGVLDPSTVEVKRRLVTIDTVNVKNFKTFVEVQASVESDKTANASSEQGGRITSLVVDEGDYVTKGQLIATTDMEVVNKSIAEVEKALELATDVFNRQSNLWKQNIGSELQYLQAKNNKEQLEKKLESIRFNLTKANVYAPMAGVVDMVYSKQGEMAGPGSPILKIMSTGVIKVVAQVSEDYLKSVKRGDRVRVEFPSLEIERNARISSIGRSINAANRTFAVEINLSNKGNKLKPNMMSIVHINDFSARNAVVVPTELIQQDVSGNSYVFIQEEGNDGPMAKRVFIETEQVYEGETYVTKGLNGGEMVIVQGAREVSDREPLKVLRIEDAVVESPTN